MARALFVWACPMKCHVRSFAVTHLADLLGELLLAVLADVANPEIAQFPHDGCRMELGHHDPRQGARIAARCMCSVRDPGVDLGEPVGEVTHC